MYIIFSDVMLYSADCNDSDIRLMGGPSMWEGRVEIFLKNTFITVCKKAQVVCRQLGYTGPGLNIFHSIMHHSIFCRHYLNSDKCRNGCVDLSQMLLL